MATLPAWVSQAPATFDVVAPLKARAFDVVQAVLRSGRRPVDPVPRLMPKGIERC
ncbi:hypothetical protein MYSE111917_06875 [Mycobacterium senriense]|uniref:Uncharacterized protein n=1 Tax=Mycobacterium senriense TaxID=2775496 RepID=A0ABN6ID10_9MYCO|nr:hypothetical protein [Mycobacterium senriense]BCZ21559.1 hypothetical protein MTY59_14140 [Mycobacterium senriense]